MSRFAFFCAGFMMLLTLGCLTPSAGDLRTEPASSNIVTNGNGLKCQVDPGRSIGVDYSKPGPFQVGLLEQTFEDPHRPVPANAKHPAAPARTLPTSIYYPAEASVPLFGNARLARGGPFPLLIHSHGYGSSRSEASQLGNRAASHGYIVVAMDFPFTSTDRILAGESLDTSDIINQAGDVSFLIETLLLLSRDPQHVLANAVDQTRIGATGVSLGGLTTLLVAYHPKLQDPRIQAAAPIAPLSSFFMPDFYHTRELPLLLMAGDQDAFINYQTNAHRSFERAFPNAQLVTFKKGTHAAFAFQLDATTLALMNSLLAPPGADPANADAFGCAVTGETLSSDHDYMPPLGGKENLIDYDPVREPILMCQGDEYKHAGMDALEQVELATRGVLAFFQAHFAEAPETRDDACHFLLHELAKNPAVSVD